MAKSTNTEQQAGERAELSALMDGELDDRDVAAACGFWRQGGDARVAWHTYHLIGDTLRSDELSTGAAHDAAFLDALRLRLADEPVVLAPKPLESVSAAAQRQAQRGRRDAPGRRRAWLAPSAIAAGFMSVAVVLVLTAAPGPLDAPRETPVATDGAPTAVPGGALAIAPRSIEAPRGLAAASMPRLPAADEPQFYVADKQLIRNARLDRYLSAHQQFAGSAALGMPSGYMRHATADAGPR